MPLSIRPAAPQEDDRTYCREMSHESPDGPPVTFPEASAPAAQRARVPIAPQRPAPSPAGTPRSELTAEERLSGDMLMLTTGFMMCAAALWLAIYWSMGYHYSTAIPLVFQVLSVITIALYWKFKRLYTFAVFQLALILFTPFAMQWSIGNFV